MSTRAKRRVNWKRQALAAERLRFESVRNWQTGHEPVRMDLLALGVAHEFNNILGAALGHADWALESLTPKDMKEALEVIQIACIRCAQITKSLQGVVQPREEEKAILLLSNLLAEIEKLWQARAEKSRAELDFESSDLRFYLDASAFMEIFANLLKNSFEVFERNATVEPKIVVRVEVKDGFAELIIEDNGPGIPETHRPYMFQPFFSTKGSISAVYDNAEGANEAAPTPKNSGLGLFLSKALAQEMGGDLRLIDTPEGKGAKFVLSLPLVS